MLEPDKRRTFPETGPLTDWNSDIVKNALKTPSNYCLKILREGGAAGNLFGDEIIPKMAEMNENEAERLKYILMRYLKPTISPNILGELYSFTNTARLLLSDSYTKDLNIILSD